MGSYHCFVTVCSPNFINDIYTCIHLSVCNSPFVSYFPLIVLRLLKFSIVRSARSALCLPTLDPAPISATRGYVYQPAVFPAAPAAYFAVISTVTYCSCSMIYWQIVLIVGSIAARRKSIRSNARALYKVLLSPPPI
jgi:hypothetical protein